MRFPAQGLSQLTHSLCDSLILSLSNGWGEFGKRLQCRFTQEAFGHFVFVCVSFKTA
jgi:hypothetical protein